MGRIGGVLFWRSFRQFNGVNGSGLTTVYTAFGVSLALWAAFVIADEIFIAYETANLEGTHMGIFASQLITLLVLRLLPDDGK
jgi:predicted ABC-type ATPase